MVLKNKKEHEKLHFKSFCNYTSQTNRLEPSGNYKRPQVKKTTDDFKTDINVRYFLKNAIITPLKI